MGLAAFIERRRLVKHGAVEYRCQPLTMAAVLRAVELFGLEIEAVLRTWNELKELDGYEEHIRVMFLGSRHRLAEVLAECVTPADGLAEALGSRELAEELLDGVLTATGPLGPIFEDLGFTARVDGETAELADIGDRFEELGIDARDLSVCRVAAAFGRSPFEVMRWPYTAFLAAQSVITYLEPGVLREALSGVDGEPGASTSGPAPLGELAALPGIEIHGG